LFCLLCVYFLPSVLSAIKPYLFIYLVSLTLCDSFLHFLSNKEWEDICYNWCGRNSVDSERETSRKVPKWK